MYFVHWGEASDNGKFDRFYHLSELRKPGSEKTLAETYKETLPDPRGGPLKLNEAVEAAPGSRWATWRVADHIGNFYVLFPEDAAKASYATEAWATLNQMRKPGATATIEKDPPAKPATPDKLADVQVGTKIEAYKRGGYGWFAATVMAVDSGRYYVQAGADSAVKGWVQPVHMRPVGKTDRFEPEKLELFVGTWQLAGDAFFTTVKSVDKGDRIEKTMELNSGAGQDAGQVVINADGTYVLSKTAVFRDGVPGKWVRNEDQGEGGILLKDGEREGKDLCVTPYPDGRIYLQGSLRGPGKIGTKATK
jgi:hypothetical protein